MKKYIFILQVIAFTLIVALCSIHTLDILNQIDTKNVNIALEIEDIKENNQKDSILKIEFNTAKNDTNLKKSFICFLFPNKIFYLKYPPDISTPPPELV